MAKKPGDSEPDGHEKFFVMFPIAFLGQTKEKLTPTEALVYIAVKSHIWERGGQCWANAAKLGKLACGIGRSQAYEGLAGLVRKGYLVRGTRKRPGKPDGPTYELGPGGHECQLPPAMAAPIYKPDIAKPKAKAKPRKAKVSGIPDSIIEMESGIPDKKRPENRTEPVRNSGLEVDFPELDPLKETLSLSSLRLANNDFG